MGTRTWFIKPVIPIFPLWVGSILWNGVIDVFGALGDTLRVVRLLIIGGTSSVLRRSILLTGIRLILWPLSVGYLR